MGFRWCTNLNEELQEFVCRATAWTIEKKLSTGIAQYLITCIILKWTGQGTRDSTAGNNCQPGREGRGGWGWTDLSHLNFYDFSALAKPREVRWRGSVLRSGFLPRSPLSLHRILSTPLGGIFSTHGIEHLDLFPTSTSVSLPKGSHVIYCALMQIPKLSSKPFRVRRHYRPKNVNL